MERRRIEFTGRVQGVGFRATAHSAATRHPVTGWVQNQPEGTVLMEVQGEAASIDAFLNDIRSQMGRLIRAEHAAMMAVDPQERGFEVRR
jgi:acylphosphatase